MGVRGYEETADGSDFDQNWTEDIAKALGRITDVGLYPIRAASYYIFAVGATYYALNGRTGIVDDSNAVLLTLTQAINDSLTASNGGVIHLMELEEPGTTLDDDVLIVENYRGRRRVFSNLGMNLHVPSLAADPGTGGWGASEEPYSWYNSTVHKYKFWNGSSVQTMPSVGGGTTYKLAPFYTIYEDGGTYYAMDEDGTNVYSGAVFSTVLNNAIDANGVTIYLHGDTFLQTAPIVDNGFNNVTLQGAGKYATKLDLQSGITAIELTLCSGWTIADLEIDGNDHAADGHYGIEIDTVTDFRVENVYIHNIAYTTQLAYGMRIDDSQRGAVINVRVEECDHSGITIETGSTDVNLIKCIGINNANGATAVKSAHFTIYGGVGDLCVRCNIIDCIGIGSDNQGVQIYRYAEHCYVIGGHYEDATSYCVMLGHLAHENTCEYIGAIGVTIKTAAGNSAGMELRNDGTVVMGCSIEAAVGRAIRVYADHCTITGNSITDDYINLNEANWNVISNNIIIGGATAFYIESNSTYNRICNNVLADQATYGIEIKDSNCDYNWLLDNTFDNVPTLVSDASSTTKYASKVLPFVQGTTFLSADGVAWGWEIDADTEYAIALGSLPLKAQQSIKWRIKATSLVAEADGMQLEIVGRGGLSNEAYTAKSVDVADKTSETTNFAVNDEVYWLLTATDDVDIDDYVGGDSIRVKVKHEAAGNGDCATDAVFLCVEVEYV